MGKGSKPSSGNLNSAKGGTSWGFEDHVSRVENKLKKWSRRNNNKADDELKASYTYKRSFLAHDTPDQKDIVRLRLHITKVGREIEQWRKRLTQWDDVEEEKRRKREEEEAALKRKAEEEELLSTSVKRRKGKLGPETWKLRGAARPAWEVYDFDTRYVDPYLKEHEEAKEKAKRQRNLLVLYRGKFGMDAEDGPPQPYCRTFLSLLVQLGHICVEAKKYKQARLTFLECMELEGTDSPSSSSSTTDNSNTTNNTITNSRNRLMRMYMDANRPDSVRRLWERLPSNDASVWIR